MSGINFNALKAAPGSQVQAGQYNQLIDYVRSITLSKGDGYYIHRTMAGTTIKPRGGNGGLTQDSHPFKVYTRTNPDNPALFQAKVELNSSLMKSIKADDRQIITGLDEWFDYTPGGDFIWLEITLNGYGGTTAATINSYGLGGAWAPGDGPQAYGTNSGPFEYDTYYDGFGNPYYSQYIARIGIFQSTYSSVEPYPILDNQLLNTHLCMEGDIWTGGPIIPIVMPKPYAGPYIAL